jgi:hypothetical protein
MKIIIADRMDGSGPGGNNTPASRRKMQEAVEHRLLHGREREELPS